MKNTNCCEWRWQWTVNLSETCRVLYQNKVQKQCISLAIIIRLYHDARSSECQSTQHSFSERILELHIRFQDAFWGHYAQFLEQEEKSVISLKSSLHEHILHMQLFLQCPTVDEKVGTGTHTVNPSYIIPWLWNWAGDGLLSHNNSLFVKWPSHEECDYQCLTDGIIH